MTAKLEGFRVEGDFAHTIVRAGALHNPIVGHRFTVIHHARSFEDQNRLLPVVEFR